MPLWCVDVDYRADRVVTAALRFDAWTDAEPRDELARTSSTPPQPYEPGKFSQRELPYLLEALTEVAAGSIVVIDGHVWLGDGVPGLGARLHDRHPARPIVVGVAKRPWRGGGGLPVTRGTSAVPLLVTAVGMRAADAARAVAAMHGPHRLPTLLKRVDRLCRDHDR